MKTQLKRALLQQLRQYENQALNKALDTRSERKRSYQFGKAEAYQVVRHIIADLQAD